MKYFLLTILLLSQSYLFAQSTKKGILTYLWTINQTDYLYDIRIDSTLATHPLLFETLRDKKGELGCVTPFLLNNESKSEIKIKIRYKTENCDELYLKVSTIGECEQINSIDTLHLALDNKWTVSCQSIAAVNSCFFNLSINAKGTKQNNAKIWISRLEIWVDGQSINVPLPIDNRIETLLKKEDIIPIRNETLSSLPFLNRKILFIGETIHGTEAMNNLGIKIIKDRIINKNCKLVLLEMPLDYSLYINRYLDGDQNFKLDSISNRFDLSLISYSFKSLIQWIKNYNMHSKEKVYFLGIDSNIIQMQSQMDLFNFFYTLNIGINNKEIDRICTSLLHNKSLFKDALAVFDANHGFKDIFNKKESELIRYCLKSTDRISSTRIREAKRDSTMYENTNYLINNLLKANETVTGFCHLAHANYLNNFKLTDFEQYSFGYYMKNKYRDDYSCIGIVAETGNCLTMESARKFRVDQLDPPPYNSIELLMSKFNIDSCYLSINKFNYSDAMKIRFLGNGGYQNRKQFVIIIPKSRMDGVIFIKQVSKIYKSKHILNKTWSNNAILMGSIEQALRKVKAMQEN